MKYVDKYRQLKTIAEIREERDSDIRIASYMLGNNEKRIRNIYKATTIAIGELQQKMKESEEVMKNGKNISE